MRFVTWAHKLYTKYFLWIFNWKAFQPGEDYVGIMTYKYDTCVDEINLHIEIISSKKYKNKAQW